MMARMRRVGFVLGCLLQACSFESPAPQGATKTAAREAGKGPEAGAAAPGLVLEGSGPVCPDTAQVVPQVPLRDELALAISPDGGLLAGVAEDEIVVLSEVASGRHVAEVEGRSPRFSRDGRALFVRRGGSLVRVELPGLAARAVVSAPAGSLGLAVDDAGERAVSVTEGRLAVWDAASGARRCEGEHAAARAELALAGDGGRVWTCAKDQVAVWDASTCRVLASATLSGHCQALGVDAEGRRLVVQTREPSSGGFVGHLEDPDRVPDGEPQAPSEATDVRDAATLAREAIWPQSGRPEGFVFRPDGRAILSAALLGAGLVELDLGSGAIAEVELAPRTEVHALAFSADGKRLGVVGPDRSSDGYDRGWVSQLRVWSWPERRLISATPAAQAKQVLPIRALPHGQTLLTFETDELQQGLRRVDTWEPVRAIFDVPTRFAFSTGGEHLAAVAGGEVRLLDTRTGAAREGLKLAGRAGGLAFSGDGSRLLVYTGDGRLHVIDVAKFEVERVFTGAVESRPGTDPGSSVAPSISPDGAWVLYARAKEGPALWAVATGKKVRALGAEARDAAWSADGGRVALRGADAVQVFAVGSGEVVASIPLRASEVLLSRDGAALAGLTAEGAVILHALGGAPPRTLAEEARGIAWASDGALVATMPTQHAAWTVPGGAAAGRVEAPWGARVVRVADGRWLVARGGRLQIHAADGALLASRLQSREGAWAAWTPAGTWDVGDPRGARLIAGASGLAPCSGHARRVPGLWQQALAGGVASAGPKQ